LAKAGVFSTKVSGIADGTDLETTEHDTWDGQVIHTMRRAETWGRMHEIEVTVYGWHVFLLLDAATKMPVTADARAQAAADAGLTMGRRVHTVRHGQGKTARTERLETEVVGIASLTTDDPYGTPEHGRQPYRRNFQPNPINAVVVRKWRGKDDEPGGTTAFLAHASVAKPLQPCDDDDDRSLIEHCGINEAKQPWELGHPPPKTDRAVRVHVMFTRLRFALATPALGADPRPGDRLCPRLLWHLPARRILAAVGSEAQRCLA
jgi:hypothetical protein